MLSMTPKQKQQRYQRIVEQLDSLLKTTNDPISRMATTASLLYHKMGHFFWIGFYRLVDNELLVGPYQGMIACQKLKKDTGVCWAGIKEHRTILVPDVNLFPGHIACDARSKSEIVVPVADTSGNIVAVLDGDSDKKDTFDEIDAEYLSIIAKQIYSDSSSSS